MGEKPSPSGDDFSRLAVWRITGSQATTNRWLESLNVIWETVQNTTCVYSTAALFTGAESGEQIWNMLRRDYFAIAFFNVLDAATAQAEFGLAEIVANKFATRQLTNWPWISAILKT